MSQPNVLHAPWEADGHAIFDAYSVMVASVGLASRTRDDAHEIARLIAAAPQMLEALKGALKVPRPWMDGGITYYEWRAAFDAIQLAIIAATGGAQ